MRTNVNFTVHVPNENTYSEDFTNNNIETLFELLDSNFFNSLFEEATLNSIEVALSLNNSELPKINITVEISSQKFDTITQEETTCSICMNEYIKEDWVSILVKCKHIFHTKCIKEWLKYKKNCPICREELN